jgi:small subunit ribosomal protein S16
MVTIRLARFGRKKGAFYRIIAVDSTKKTVGENLGVLGYWNPAKKDLKVEKEKLSAWVKKGAQVSATVKKLILK